MIKKGIGIKYGITYVTNMFAIVLLENKKVFKTINNIGIIYLFLSLKESLQYFKPILVNIKISNIHCVDKTFSKRTVKDFSKANLRI